MSCFRFPSSLPLAALVLLLPFGACQCGGEVPSVPDAGPNDGKEPDEEEPPAAHLDGQRLELLERPPLERDGVVGEAGAVLHADWAVVLSEAGEELGRAAVNADGSFLEVDIGDNAHARVLVRAETADGERTEGLELDNDVEAPALSFAATPPALTNEATARFELVCEEPGCALACALDGSAFSGCTTPYLLHALAEGPHALTVRALDRAGNAAEVRHEWRVDVTAPTALIAAGPAPVDASGSASFSFACDEEGCNFECSLDDALFSPCSPAHEVSELDDGRHELRVRAIDAAGNAGDATSHAWTVDTLPPGVLFIGAPPSPSAGTDAVFAFACDEGTCSYQCSLDGADFTPCSTPTSYADLSDGPHTVLVRATDEAGNEGPPASHAWLVDTTPPAVTLVSAPPALGNATSAHLSFTCDEAECAFQCALDDEPLAPCTSPVAHAGLLEGAHLFTVKASDAAGNVGAPTTHAWTIDLTGPQATIASGPAPLTNDTHASFSFSCDDDAGCAYQCGLDGAAFTACSAAFALEGLSDGEHSLAVRAVDGVGNAGPEVLHAWTVDTDPPTVTFTTTPDALTAETTAAFDFTCGEAGCSYECRLDGADFAPCTSPASYADLSDGPHTVLVRATDEAGNEGPPASHAWLVDATPPVVTVVAGPPALGNATSAELSFTCHETECSFQCTLDDGPLAPCTSPVAYAGLLEGAHLFTVKASDAAGNVGAPTTHAWTIDLTGPQATIASGPAPLTNDTHASFSFSCDDDAGCAYQCGLDGAAFTACSAAFALEGLSDGEHSLAVRAIDGVGNAGPEALHAWTVDTDPPTVTFTTTPEELTTETTATFDFTCGEAGCSYECGLDGAPLSPCEAPVVVEELERGEHVFVVRAIDVAGNAGPETHVAWTVRGFTWVQLSAGYGHTCGVALDGTLWCWGDNNAGRLGDGTTISRPSPTRVGSDTDWVSVRAGSSHTCGVKAGGELWCWGENYEGQLGDGTTSYRSTPTRVGADADWAEVGAGYKHSCGLKTNGELWCWGRNDRGQLGDGTTAASLTPTRVAAATDWASLSVGHEHACGVTTSGEAWCWGRNDDGQLGNGTTTVQLSPTQVGTEAEWASVAAGNAHTCGVRKNGELRCWGSNGNFAISSGLPGELPSPVSIGSDLDWARVAPGQSYTCGLKADGALWCWGENDRGQHGDGSERPVPAEVPGKSDWVSLTTGAAHTCAIDAAGEAWCWGSNSTSQLGLGLDGAAKRRPVPVAADPGGLALAAGFGRVCGVAEDDSLWCWGTNDAGELGLDSRTARSAPALVDDTMSWASVTAGLWHACALTTAGELWGWGLNANGSLAGLPYSNPVPAQIVPGTDWRAAAAGYQHSCALRTDGTLWCWGSNYYGQLGDGTTTERSSPAQVGSATDWTSVSAMGAQTCGIRADGSLWCWGQNASGQLGDGTTVSRSLPVRIGAGISWASVELGWEHTCAVTTSGGLWCWGRGWDGELGNGTRFDRTSPTRVDDASWASVSAGSSSTCGVRTDGTLWCWGFNSSGQVGDGSLTTRWSPVRIGIDASWDAVSVGNGFACARDTDGGTWCWGANHYGQVGDGTGNVLEPTRVSEPM